MFGGLRRLLGRLSEWSPTADSDTSEFVALDLETTGLNPKRDAILSAGWVPIRGGVIRWGERRYRLVRPDGRAEGRGDQAVAIHGLLPDETADAESVAALVDELADALIDRTLVVHWGRLDVGILRRVFREHEVPWPNPRVVDTVHLLHRLDRRRNLTVPHAEATPTQLPAARAQLGLPPHDEHDALHDALATAELFLALRARLA